MKVVVATPLHGYRPGHRTRALTGALALSWLATACTGTVGPGGDDLVGGNGTPGMPNKPGTPGAGGSSGSPGTGGTAGTNPVVPGPPAATMGDVGRVGIHRLNNTEYDNTIRDLLGVTASAREGFISDEKAAGFDSIAAAFGMDAARFEQYFTSGQALAEKAFADTAARGRIVTCAPSSPTDQTCLKNIVKAFGQRAYRRPLSTTEIESLAKLATDAIAAGEDFNGGVKQVVATLLASAPFLYRVEMDADPASKTPHKLNGYELASRLSYFHWSTMPDETLMGLAGSGDLLKDDVLSAQIERMLNDPRGQEFTANFAGQWLGFRSFKNHQVEATVFPNFDDALRQSMLKESTMFFNEFLNGRPMSEFFTADINFIDTKLGAFYGIPGGTAEMKKVTHTADQRVGFLGLGSFLSNTSFAYRTAPTLRGTWVMDHLLCEPIHAPDNIPELDKPGTPMAEMPQSQNVRVRLAAHRVDPKCAGCHNVLDPIGFGLENFDAVGAYRTKYLNGDPIDSSGVMPDGKKFNGLPAMAAMLGDASDTRLIDCTVQKVMTYALSRELGDADKLYVDQVRARWKQDGLGLRNLIKAVVLNDTFRLRRGEAL